MSNLTWKESKHALTIIDQQGPNSEQFAKNLVQNGLLSIVAEAAARDTVLDISQEDMRKFFNLSPKKLILPSLNEDVFISDLLEKNYFDFFSKNVKEFSGGIVKSSGKILSGRFLKKSGKVTTEQEILKVLPGCKNLEGEDLLEKAKKHLPSFDELFGNMVAAIIESEEGCGNFPISKGIWAMGCCVKNNQIQTMRFLGSCDGWYVYCNPMVINDEWPDEYLLISTVVS